MKTRPVQEGTVDVRVAGEVKIDAYRVLDEAVIEGINWGWSRAHKHVETPGESVIKENMHREIMTALCEVLRFDD